MSRRGPLGSDRGVISRSQHSLYPMKPQAWFLPTPAQRHLLPEALLLHSPGSWPHLALLRLTELTLRLWAVWL